MKKAPGTVRFHQTLQLLSAEATGASRYYACSRLYVECKRFTL